MRTFPGVPWTWGIKRQWDKQKRRFSGLLDASWSYSKFYQMLKLSCRDHKTFSLRLGLHIGYKDYICLLTYSINCIFPTTMNINIYLFTVVINKTTAVPSTRVARAQ